MELSLSSVFSVCPRRFQKRSKSKGLEGTGELSYHFLSYSSRPQPAGSAAMPCSTHLKCWKNQKPAIETEVVLNVPCLSQKNLRKIGYCHHWPNYISVFSDVSCKMGSAGNASLTNDGNSK